MGSKRFNTSDPTANKAISNADKAAKNRRAGVKPFTPHQTPEPARRLLTREFPALFAGLLPHEARMVGIKAFQAAGSMEAITGEHLTAARAEIVAQR